MDRRIVLTGDRFDHWIDLPEGSKNVSFRIKFEDSFGNVAESDEIVVEIAPIKEAGKGDGKGYVLYVFFLLFILLLGSIAFFLYSRMGRKDVWVEE